MTVPIFGAGDDLLADHHIADFKLRRQRPAQADGDHAADIAMQGIQLGGQAAASPPPTTTTTPAVPCCQLPWSCRSR